MESKMDLKWELLKENSLVELWELTKVVTLESWLVVWMVGWLVKKWVVQKVQMTVGMWVAKLVELTELSLAAMTGY